MLLFNGFGIARMLDGEAAMVGCGVRNERCLEAPRASAVRVVSSDLGAHPERA